ncbi:hypothetical protein DN752_11920 [Echinicola strongylocentroti]|uniref:DoxX family membrane protein n=1 Tax=Echinicola strongylocentroti TaxID=1795355 RepID=A0A2Z4IK72_9BACT|nr:hypothetical protein [Echinicola strongylocentroti]AWW30773.1 hypothetical protein DN752_11920 [Echinicola strongylocentroti]
MLPFYVLIFTFVLAVIVHYWRTKTFAWAISGRIALSVMLCLTAMGHFMFTEGMSKMLPHFIPQKAFVVYFTGLIEMAAAVGIHLHKYRKSTGILLILFFLLVLPANIKASMDQLNYQTGQYDGPGVNYLWFRVPFQLLLIAWTSWFVIKNGKEKLQH